MTRADRRGARVIFTAGKARLAPGTPPPPGWKPALASLISPGTELRRLAATAVGPDRAAGYMTLARRSGGDGLVLAAVPHGAPVAPDEPTALPVPGVVAAEHAAVARFQLIAACGLSAHARLVRDAPRVLVIGGGPVATGCVLELIRLGARQVTVATRHPAPAAAVLPGVAVTRQLPDGERVVIECAGQPARALGSTAPGGFLGLLGTPGDGVPLPAAAVHRAGITVAGMHELAGYDPAARQSAFGEVLQWLTASIPAASARSWCRTIPGEAAPGLYRQLQGQDRQAEPFLLLDWSTS